MTVERSVVEAYQAGAGTNRIAREHGIGRAKVEAILAEAGVARRPPAIPQPEPRRAPRLPPRQGRLTLSDVERANRRFRGDTEAMCEWTGLGPDVVAVLRRTLREMGL